MVNNKDVKKTYSAGCYICKTYVPDLTFKGQADAVFKHIEIKPRHLHTVGAEGVGFFEENKFRVVSLDEFLKA